MADNGSIVFPDDVERVKRECQSKNTNSGMADNDRIVFPDEVEETKEKVVQESEEVDKNTVEEPPPLGSAQMRNMIVAPGNCPPGMTRGADGICRETF